MPTTFKGVKVICPYYADKEEKHCITCEGVMDGTLTKVCFKKTDTKEKYRLLFCERNYEKCKVAKMLDRKYK
jgi:hypothetical protein